MKPPPRTAFLLRYPSEERQLIIERFSELHDARMRYLVPLLLLLAVFFLASDILAQGALAPETYHWYLRLDSFFLALQIAALVSVQAAGPRLADGRRRVARGIMYAYAQAVLLWAAVVSAIDFRETGNATAIIIAVMGVSTLALFPLAAISALVLSSLAVFLLGAFLLPTATPPPIFPNLVFVIGLLLVSLFVSQSLFSAFVRSTVSQERLARANEELRTVQRGLVHREKFATIGQLSAGIVHEINNPLAYLKSNFSTLETAFRYISGRVEGQEGDPSYAHLVEEMGRLFRETREGFRHISEVIENLRLFSRVPPPDYFGRYDLRRGVESALVLAHSAYAGIATIVKDLAPVPEIEARGSEINQVLLNLLLNAVNAIESGPRTEEGVIGISCRSDGLHVHCDVSDSGPGVPEEIRSAGEGLGLGLSLSYEIVVNRHHGSLRLLDGRPTTFRITLPVHQPREAES